MCANVLPDYPMDDLSYNHQNGAFNDEEMNYIYSVMSHGI